MSRSSTQLTFFRVIPTLSASSASSKRNMDRKPLQKALPGPTAPLTPPPKLVKPQTQHVFPEHSHSLLVTRYGVVLEVPPHHRLQPFQGIRRGLVHAPFQLHLNFFQLSCHALADGLPRNREVARLVARPTHVDETQKVKGLWPSLPPPFPV